MEIIILVQKYSVKQRHVLLTEGHVILVNHQTNAIVEIFDPAKFKYYVELRMPSMTQGCDGWGRIVIDVYNAKTKGFIESYNVGGYSNAQELFEKICNILQPTGTQDTIIAM
jgi:hypothetical protein